MTHTIIPAVAGIVLSVSSVFAAPDLRPNDAVRLIAMKNNIQENMINISFIVAGDADCHGFKVTDVKRVAALQPVRRESALTRKLVFHDFYWNEQLGWFMWEPRTERTGDVVYLWSELKGEIVNR